MKDSVFPEEGPSLAFAAGPPRTGTTMISRVMSVIVPAHHECGTGAYSNWQSLASNGERIWLGEEPNLSIIPRHQAFESAFWFVPYAPYLDRPLIHLWRPAVEWVRSMLGRGLHSHENNHLWMANPPQIENYIESLCWAYNHQHSFMLEQEAYRISLGEGVDWIELCEWCEISPPSDEQLVEMQKIEVMRPNRGKQLVDLTDTENSLVKELCGDTEATLRKMK